MFSLLIISGLFFGNEALADSVAPRITSFSVTPEVVDTSSGPQTLTLRMSIEDDESDICLSIGDVYNCIDTNFSGPTYSMVNFKSIGNDAADYVSFYNFQLVSGTMRNGTFVSELALPQGSRVGPWSLKDIMVMDSANNWRLYSPWRYPATARCNLGSHCEDSIFSDIAGASGTVIGNSGVSNSFYIESEYTMINPDGGTKVTFPAGTTVSRSDGGSFALYKLINQKSLIDGLPTAGLSGNIAEIIKIGIPDLKLSFSQPVRIDLKVSDGLSGKTLAIRSLNDGDTSWTNEGSCKVRDDVCTFTINHASYFAATSGKKIKQAKTKVSIGSKKKVKKSSARISIKSNPYAILDIKVNGVLQRTAVANKKGKYAVRVNLSKGKNTVTVTASKNAKTATRSKLITRKR